MNKNKLDQFITLVSTVRNAQNQFWHNGRQKDDLNKSLALETRLDQYLASCKQFSHPVPAMYLIAQLKPSSTSLTAGVPSSSPISATRSSEMPIPW